MKLNTKKLQIPVSTTIWSYIHFTLKSHCPNRIKMYPAVHYSYLSKFNNTSNNRMSNMLPGEYGEIIGGSDVGNSAFTGLRYSSSFGKVVGRCSIGWIGTNTGANAARKMNSLFGEGVKISSEMVHLTQISCSTKIGKDWRWSVVIFQTLFANFLPLKGFKNLLRILHGCFRNNSRNKRNCTRYNWFRKENWDQGAPDLPYLRLNIKYNFFYNFLSVQHIFSHGGA